MTPSTESYSKSLAELQQLIQKLRSPNGCPWDQKQTAKSMVPFLIEEAYEVVDAITNESPQDVCNELGDLLMLIFFITDIYNDADEFTLNNVSQNIQEKLIRRHPHVFATATKLNDHQINAQWEQIKETEQPEKQHKILPHNLPALNYAQKWLNHPLSHKPPSTTTAIDHTTLCTIDESTNKSTVETILGKVLMQCAQLANKYQIDAESCLRYQVKSQISAITTKSEANTP